MESGGWGLSLSFQDLNLNQGPSPAQAELPLPIAVSRHDQHNLELKIGLNCGSARQNIGVDLYLFLPKSLHISEWSRQELRQDIHSRLRLAMQQTVSRHETTLHALRANVAKHLITFQEQSSAATLELLLQETRSLGAVVGELLKYESRRLRNELLAVTSKSRRSLQPETTLGDVKSILQRVDRLVHQAIDLAESETAREIPVMRLLGEYVHHLYTDFLAGICDEQQAMGSPEHEELKLQWDALSGCISDLRVSQAKAFRRFEQSSAADKQVVHDLRLLRLSQIKKFFQSQMFIEVTRKETIRRFSEPAAAGAAAFAAMWAGAFEYFSQPKLHTVGFGGTIVICTGVALYVLKDRLKDKFRHAFTAKLETILPEAEQSLQADGKRIGIVREWFRILTSAQVPTTVIAARRRGDLTLAESHLPEDVIHYGQEFELEPTVNSYGEFERSVQQILRINIERFLKHLDDAYKTVGLLDREGDFKLVRSRRIYHFHAAVVVKKKPLRPQNWLLKLRSKPSFDSGEPMLETLYRVVVDKNGIERVDSI